MYILLKNYRIILYNILLIGYGFFRKKLKVEFFKEKYL